MFKSVLFLLLRAVAAFLLAGLLLACLWLLVMIPFIGWDMVRWEYYASLRSFGWMGAFATIFLSGTLHIMAFIALLMAFPMLLAIFCGVIGWSKPAAKIWGFSDYLHALGNKMCATG